MGELYRLDFPSGKSYIGITRHTAQHRYKGHQACAAKSAKGAVYQAWRKYGPPVLVVLAEMETDELYKAEQAAIAEHGTLTPGGYNITPGGDVPPSLTPSVAEKIAAKLRGTKLSQERKEAMRIIMTGRKASEESRARMSAAQRGKVISDAGRANMSEAAKRRRASPETKAAMSEAQRRRRHQEGCKLKRPYSTEAQS